MIVGFRLQLFVLDCELEDFVINLPQSFNATERPWFDATLKRWLTVH